jgi:hypothetical protein
MRTFSRWQPAYAAHGIATFPVTAEKKPAIKGWQRVGIKGSAALASKKDSDAFGYVTGQRSNVTVLDIDTTDARVVEDAIRRHGQPRIIKRTASSKFHLLYRYNGERRRIRPWAALPIDVLGDNGYALAAPSSLAAGSYEIVHGHIDDLDRLSVMRHTPAPAPAVAPAPAPTQVVASVIGVGQRNNTLWRHCMRQAHHCDDFDALLDVARTFNVGLITPLEDAEVMRVAQSAWDYTERGQNRLGQHGAWFPTEEIGDLLQEQDVLFLLAFLRANQGPSATFMCANGLAETLGWGRKRLAAARHRLIELGYMRPVRRARRGVSAMFQWNSKISRSNKGGQI